MKKNRPPFLGRLLLSFILANIIFIIIIGISFQISNSNYKKISKENNQILKDIENLNNILDQSSLCDDSTILTSSQILDRVGSKLSILETRFGKEDMRVLEQKKLYSEIEFKHFQIIKRLEGRCEKDYLPIFFFYSNQKNLESESERMGFILGKFKRQNTENVMIYSFDSNLDYSLIRDLKSQHNITSVPIVLINEENLVYIRNIDDLDSYLIG